MADIRESFPTTESAAGVGVPLAAVVEGDAAAAKQASAALVAKNAAGNLIYLRTDAAGNLLTTSEGTSTCKRAKGELAAGSAALAEVTGASIALTVNKEYQNIGFIVSCLRDALYQIVWDDDGTESILGEIVVGPGTFTVSSELHCLSFTAGATGTQTLKVMAKNFNSLSSLRASVTVQEMT